MSEKNTPAPAGLTGEATREAAARLANQLLACCGGHDATKPDRWCDDAQEILDAIANAEQRGRSLAELPAVAPPGLPDGEVERLAEIAREADRRFVALEERVPHAQVTPWAQLPDWRKDEYRRIARAVATAVRGGSDAYDLERLRAIERETCCAPDAVYADLRKEIARLKLADRTVDALRKLPGTPAERVLMSSDPKDPNYRLRVRAEAGLPVEIAIEELTSTAPTAQVTETSASMVLAHEEALWLSRVLAMDLEPPPSPLSSRPPGGSGEGCTCTGPARDAHDMDCPVRLRNPRVDLGDPPIPAACRGEFCGVCWRAGRGKVQAATKVGEEILHDDPHPYRHNLTQYVCRGCFETIMGPLASSAPVPPPPAPGCKVCLGIGVRPNKMDAPDGPVCGCGFPSRLQSGACGRATCDPRCDCAAGRALRPEDVRPTPAPGGQEGEGLNICIACLGNRRIPAYNAPHAHLMDCSTCGGTGRNPDRPPPARPPEGDGPWTECHECHGDGGRHDPEVPDQWYECGECDGEGQLPACRACWHAVARHEDDGTCRVMCCKCESVVAARPPEGGEPAQAGAQPDAILTVDPASIPPAVREAGEHAAGELLRQAGEALMPEPAIRDRFWLDSPAPFSPPPSTPPAAPTTNPSTISSKLVDGATPPADLPPCYMCSAPAENRDALGPICAECVTDLLDATSKPPATMDAPGGPVCGCGAPSKHESGWCGECDPCVDCQSTPCRCPDEDEINAARAFASWVVGLLRLVDVYERRAAIESELRGHSPRPPAARGGEGPPPHWVRADGMLMRGDSEAGVPLADLVAALGAPPDSTAADVLTRISRWRDREIVLAAERRAVLAEVAGVLSRRVSQIDKRVQAGDAIDLEFVKGVLAGYQGAIANLARHFANWPAGGGEG